MGIEDGAAGGEVDDAIQQAVKASLETAAKELNDTVERSPEAYHDPAPQPDVSRLLQVQQAVFAAQAAGSRMAGSGMNGSPSGLGHMIQHARTGRSTHLPTC